MKIPKQWSEITVRQYVEFNNLDPEDFETSLDYELEILSILTDEDIDTFLDLDFDELTDIIEKINFLKTQPREKMAKSIGYYSAINVEKLKVGEFIDLEYYFADGYVKNLTKICAIFWRKSKKNKWGHAQIEPYQFDINEREYEFLDIPLTCVYEIIPTYLKFRESFMNTYTNLFNPIIEDPEDLDELDPEDIKEEQEEQRLKKWSWEQTLYNLANEDITKIDSVLQMPLIFVFNMLSMKKDLSL